MTKHDIEGEIAGGERSRSPLLMPTALVAF